MIDFKSFFLVIFMVSGGFTGGHFYYYYYYYYSFLAKILGQYYCCKQTGEITFQCTDDL